MVVCVEGCFIRKSMYVGHTTDPADCWRLTHPGHAKNRRASLAAESCARANSYLRCNPAFLKGVITSVPFSCYRVLCFAHVLAHALPPFLAAVDSAASAKCFSLMPRQAQMNSIAITR